MSTRRVTIVGSGATGSTTAYNLALKGLADVVLLDVRAGLARGKALDISEAAPIEGFGVTVTGTDDYSVTSDSDVVVVTAGNIRKAGMSRDDLLQENAAVIRETVAAAVRYSPETIFIILTNPVDVMTYLAQKVSGLPHHRVLGQAGVLDTARFRWFIAEALGISAADVTASVIGGHGDLMVPLVRHATAGGVPVNELLSAEQLAQIVKRTQVGGGEIVELMGASAYYAPASALATMVEAILLGEDRLIPAIAYVQGAYGADGIYIGVPIILGANGVRRVVEVDLSPTERANFYQSVEAVRRLMSSV